MKKQLLLTPTLASSIALWTGPAHAFEPILTVLSVIGGPIFCKIISCKTNVVHIVHGRDSKTLNKQLQKMKDEFEWEDEFCRSSPALEYGEKFCFKNGTWKVVK